MESRWKSFQQAARELAPILRVIGLSVLFYLAGYTILQLVRGEGFATPNNLGGFLYMMFFLSIAIWRRRALQTSERREPSVAEAVERR